MSDLALEDLCIHEGLDYKLTTGAKGEQLNIKECPDCGKDSWKVYANAESGAGNCFSCGETFNVWTFVGFMLKSRSGVEPKSADIGRYIEDVRRKMGYRPKVRAAAAKPVVQTSESIVLPTSAALPYEDGWVHPYLLERRINGHYASMFGLRFSAFGKHSYTNQAGDKLLQDFSNRIIIPVHDLEGKMVTFQGRDVTGFAQEKYKFAAALPGTARYLYNGHVAKAQKAKRAVMGEGALDVIGIQKAIDTDYQYADTVPIGSWGKHLSKASQGDDQVGALTLLRRTGLEEVTMLYDPEPSAYVEALKAAELMTKIGLRAKIALLPAGCDPGDADAITILTALSAAQEYTRTSALRMKMRNPYKP